MPKTIAEKIRMIRGDLSQKEFGDKIGTYQGTVHLWERGENQPGFKYLEAIHKQFRINLNWLLTNEGDPYTSEPGAPVPAGPESQQAPPSPAIRTEIDPGVQAMADVKEIFDSGDPILVPALRANLEAFKRALRREQEIRQVLHENAQMRARIAALEKRMADLESRANPGDHNDDVAPDTEKKAM